jgi:PhnB protein
MSAQVPVGYHSVNAYLLVRDAPMLFAFLQQAFGVTEIRRTSVPNGPIFNIEICLGDSAIFLAEVPDLGQARPSSLYLYVSEVDELYRKSLSAGARSISAPADMFFGDRMAGVADPEGNEWWIASRIATYDTEELGKLAENFSAKQVKRH